MTTNRCVNCSKFIAKAAITCAKCQEKIQDQINDLCGMAYLDSPTDNGIHWLTLTYSDVISLSQVSGPLPFPGFVEGLLSIATEHAARNTNSYTEYTKRLIFPVTNPELQWAIDTLMAH